MLAALSLLVFSTIVTSPASNLVIVSNLDASAEPGAELKRGAFLGTVLGPVSDELRQRLKLDSGTGAVIDGDRQALKMLKSRSDVAADRVFIFGHSMGGVMAPLLAAEIPVRGIIAYGTITRTWTEYMLENVRRQMELANTEPAVIDRELRANAALLTYLYAEKLSPKVIAERYPSLHEQLEQTVADDEPSSLERDPEGWTDLLAQAGPELKGWIRGPLRSDAKLSDRSQWSLDPATGFLVCQGDGGHEWLRWDKELGDCTFHVELRFTVVPGKKGYNSGIYARNSADAKIWHQAQTGDGSGGFLFGDTPVNGTIKRFNLSKQQAASRVKPAGEWNVFEITCRGKEMTLWVNGAVANRWLECEAPRGYVGLEAEGYRIEFRNAKVKPLDGSSLNKTQDKG
jgi:hypothetical protein